MPPTTPGDQVTDYVVHDTARVDPGAEIGAGTRIWHFAHVMGGARIGRDCMLAQNVFIAAGAVIGDGVKIQNNVSIYDGVTLEDGVFCGPSTVFTNVVTPRSHVSRRHDFARTLVRQGATLGANSTLLVRHRDRPLRLRRGRCRGDARRAGLRTGGRQPGPARRLGLRLRRTPRPPARPGRGPHRADAALRGLRRGLPGRPGRRHPDPAVRADILPFCASAPTPD